MSDPQRIADYLEICNVKARYCRFLDTKQWAAWGDLFTEDFVLDTREAGGTLSRGRDEALRLVRGAIEHAITAHQVHSPEMAFDGDAANVIWAMQDRVLMSAGKAQQPGMPGFTGYGHYHERYVRESSGWRIAAQRLTRLHIDIHPASAA